MEHEFSSHISGVTIDDSPEQRLARAANAARLFYANLSKVAPELKKLNFEAADSLAAELKTENGDSFLMSKEYQRARQDFVEMEKIKKLLSAHQLRTAKIEYDLREPSLGAWAYETFYEGAKKEAEKSLAPELVKSVEEADFETAKNLAEEFLKTRELSAGIYLDLVKLLRPEYYFDLYADEYYYLPYNYSAEKPSLELLDYGEDVDSALEKIAESGSPVDKLLTVIWLLFTGRFEDLSLFSDEPFLDSKWFSALLKSAVRESDPRTAVKYLLSVQRPEEARLVFTATRKLSEDDYFNIVKEVAENLEVAPENSDELAENSAELAENPESAEDLNYFEEDYDDYL